MAAAAAAGVPPVEQGVSGILQSLPALTWRGSLALEQDWLAIKKDPDVEAQFKRMRRTGIERVAAPDLVDLRALEGHGLPPFGWRDRTRGRTWVTPTMAAVLVRAYTRFREHSPDVVLSLGDLSQPGGGTLLHGVVVRWLEDTPDDPAASRLLSKLRVRRGHAEAVELGTASDFPLEIGRFDSPDAPVRLEHRILGRDLRGGEDGPLRLRVATRRYTQPGPEAEAEVDVEPEAPDHLEACKVASRLIAGGVLVSSREVVDVDGAGETHRRWRQHWVNPTAGRQVITVSTRKLRRRVVPGWAREIRLAQWQARKPGSFPVEILWTAGTDGSWTRWRAVYEAGHITHMGGRDADISFVTEANLAHFAVAIEALRVSPTWQWFKALEAAAADVGTSLDRILIDRKVYRRLDAGLTDEARKTRLWKQVIKIVGGHDAHHHLRLGDDAASTAALVGAVLADLTGE